MTRRATPFAAATSPSVLLIAPPDPQRSLLASILTDAGCRTFVCARSRDGTDLIPFVSVVICERRLSDGSWQDVLGSAREMAAPPPVIVTSRVAGEDLWAEVLNLGGFDLLAQPFRVDEVMYVVRSAHRRWSAVPERPETGAIAG